MKLPIAIVLLFASPAAFGHGGEDHGAPPPAVSQDVAPRAAAATEDFEVVAALEGKHLVVYVDRFASNEPIAKAKVEVEGAGLNGLAAEAAPGAYVMNLAAPMPPAKHALTIGIEAADSADLLSATLGVAPPRRSAAPLPWWKRWLAREKPASSSIAPLATGPQRLADGSLFVPKPVQRQLGLRTRPARIGDLAATVELNGKVVPDPDSGGRVQATFAGIVMPGPKGMPLPGRKVAKGEVLAWLRPVAGAIERGNQRAQLAELEAQLAIADGRAKRLEQLEGAVPQKEIEAARIEYGALQKRRAYVAASIDSAEPLRAPAAGVISASHHLVAGQMVDAREVLFEIVDPTRLAVEALAYDAGIGATLVAASAVTDQYALDLRFVGSGRQLREQALPLLFRVATVNSMVAVGQPVKVIVRTAYEVKGAAVPRAALTKVGAGQGYDGAVWVHAEAERFVARRVRSQSLDGNNVAIVDGLHEGDRVVVEGAGLLSQVR
ncbi:MAG: HlyD family efflux transporter periplasmic adaptor subunit [Candidatus Nitricoxidivorans perseverans]|uniref:HlyD family efflux transporter periplasmic adaptor subunit n=1 Tax=Candidatus Nitricoxidivorans perseverans TaxID=2975601 RepID=A0AA49FJC9_9PROT|nr:MAG: HlyD family efflux transporter periplasmic adaptor subunit [Candidatus Nitricoxidivorans perseverans]